ncbi:PREDICTED: antigen-presenting glycoprotein CD1d-like, partial [Apaloderma vittatum]|uniref:antigen-presenting glycoprotein CD1d-like n=1 Tax=Apaloderma vittatum TaxID=57397 RepID=UPI0005217CC0
TFTVQLLQTSIFENASFVDTEGVGLMNDIELGSLDKHTWTFRFLQPWVQPALPHSDWETYENMYKIFLQKCNQNFHQGSIKNYMPYPFVVQYVEGCELFLNRTSGAFVHVGYNGQDFLSLNVENYSWQFAQDTNLSRYIKSTLENSRAFSELVDFLFNETCVDVLEVLLHYG